MSVKETSPVCVDGRRRRWCRFCGRELLSVGTEAISRAPEPGWWERCNYCGSEVAWTDNGRPPPVTAHRKIRRGGF